jgi:hypothetical protein
VAHIDSLEHKTAQSELNEVTRRFAECAAYKAVMRENAFADMLYMGYLPPTKWQKHKRRIKEFFGRFHLAWRALRGDEITFEDECPSSITHRLY